MLSILRCFFGPRLFKIYRRGHEQGRDYSGNVFESFSDSLIKTAFVSISFAWSLGFYTFPFFGAWMYRRGYMNVDNVHTIGRLASFLGVLLFSMFLTRGIGRMMNTDYIQFLGILDAYKQTKARNLKAELSRFDFDFREWPVDFNYSNSVINVENRKFIEKRLSKRNSVLDKLQSLPCGIVSYFAIHSFGRRMIYPGSVSLLNMMLSPVLTKGRARLVEHFNGQRYKLLSLEGNEIDSMFVDRRDNENYPHGNTLVICCEGNAAYYEYGIAGTPLEAGFSILGWNHPGFAGSTGIPFPEQELNAIDVVMQFAMNDLKFKPENIVIYAWSIGGFTATWAAMNYPNIRGLILDATFDDLVSLAVARMPPSWKPLVVRTIRDYMDLNIAEQVCRYNGPVLLIRRTKDEVIATSPSRSMQTNRGNDLLIKILQIRYPNLVTDSTIHILHEWFKGDRIHQADLWSKYGVEEELCCASIMSYISGNSPNFPIDLGDDLPNESKIPLIIYLASKHMINFDSTHCVPLPVRFFQLPWDPFHFRDSLCDTNRDSKL